MARANSDLRLELSLQGELHSLLCDQALRLRRECRYLQTELRWQTFRAKCLRDEDTSTVTVTSSECQDLRRA